MNKNKFELTIIGVSLGITILLSVIFGFAGSSIHGSFWGWFWISLLTQIIVFVGWNSYLIQRESIAQQEADISLLDKLSKFVVQLSCAYCKQPNNVPIQLNRKNTFKCESCNQTNSVHMQFTAVTLSTPIESVKIPLPDSESIEFKVSR